MPTSRLNNEIVVAAIEGFGSQKKRIDVQIAELRQMLNPVATAATPVPVPQKRKRRLSAAGRKGIAEAARKRWAAANAAKAEPAPIKRGGRKNRKA